MIEEARQRANKLSDTIRRKEHETVTKDAESGLGLHTTAEGLSVDTLSLDGQGKQQE